MAPQLALVQSVVPAGVKKTGFRFNPQAAAEAQLPNPNHLMMKKPRTPLIDKIMTEKSR
jgi:hypothetical protein